MSGSGGGGGAGDADGSIAAAAAPTVSAPVAADDDSDDARDLAISTLNDAKMATTAEAKVKRQREVEKRD